MDEDGCVLSAGRAVLDMVEREWQPLSAGELELRLDQAVEESLEAELVARLHSQPPPAVYLQLLHGQGPPRAPQEPRGPRALQPTVDGGALKAVAELLQTSDTRARMAGRARLSVSSTVQLSLSLLTERVSYRALSRRFRLEKGNIHRIFFSFCERVNALQEKLIRWPTGAEAAEVLVPFCRSAKAREEPRGLPRVLGVLGHTLVPIRPPAGRAGAGSGAKRAKAEARPGPCLRLELVCDGGGRLRHCRVAAGSEVGRGGTLREKLGRHPELMPPGSCLVARAGYPLSTHILTPYPGGGGAKERLFNEALAGHLGVLDQAVADLRARFERLRYLDVSSRERAGAVVLAACVLHNVFLDAGHAVRGVVEEEEEEEEGEEDAGRGDEGEGDGEGVQIRDAISDLLLRYFDSGAT